MRFRILEVINKMRVCAVVMAMIIIITTSGKILVLSGTDY